MATAPAPPRRSSRTRTIVLSSLAVVALVVVALVTWFAVWMSSGHRGLQRSLDQLQLPGQVRLVQHEQLGNPLGLDQCPMIQREYRSSLDPAATGQAFAATLSRNGFSQAEDRPETVVRLQIAAAEAP